MRSRVRPLTTARSPASGARMDVRDFMMLDIIPVVVCVERFSSGLVDHVPQECKGRSMWYGHYRFPIRESDRYIPGQFRIVLRLSFRRFLEVTESDPADKGEDRAFQDARGAFVTKILP